MDDSPYIMGHLVTILGLNYLQDFKLNFHLALLVIDSPPING